MQRPFYCNKCTYYRGPGLSCQKCDSHPCKRPWHIPAIKPITHVPGHKLQSARMQLPLKDHRGSVQRPAVRDRGNPTVPMSDHSHLKAASRLRLNRYQPFQSEQSREESIHRGPNHRHRSSDEIAGKESKTTQQPSWFSSQMSMAPVLDE